MLAAAPPSPTTTRKKALNPSARSASPVRGSHGAAKARVAPVAWHHAPNARGPSEPTSAPTATSARPAIPRKMSAASAPTAYLATLSPSRSSSGAIASPVALREPIESGQDSTQDVRRLRRTTTHKHVHGDHRVHAPNDRITAPEHPTRARTVAHGHDDLRIGCGFVRLEERDFHVAGHRAGDQEQVGVPG